MRISNYAISKTNRNRELAATNCRDGYTLSTSQSLQTTMPPRDFPHALHPLREKLPDSLVVFGIECKDFKSFNIVWQLLFCEHQSSTAE